MIVDSDGGLGWCLTFRQRMQTPQSNTVVISEAEHKLLGSYRAGSHSFKTGENREGPHLVATELLGCDTLTLAWTTNPSEMPSKR